MFLDSTGRLLASTAYEADQRVGVTPGFAGVEVELLNTVPCGVATNGNNLACCDGFLKGDVYMI